MRWRVAAQASRIRSRLRAQLAVPSVDVHNERFIYGEMLFQAMSSAGALSFISIFLVRLGAPNWLVGLYSSLPALVMILAVLPAGAFVQRQRSLIATVNWSRFAFRAFIASFALLPFLPATVAPFVLVGARSLAAIPDSILVVSVTTLLGQATTPTRRPRMLSTRNAISGLIGAGFGFLAGQWLDFAPFPLNYQVLFASAFLAGLGSIYMISRLKLPEISRQEIKAKKRGGLREMRRLIKNAPAFRNYAIAALLFRMGMSLPVALYPIYRVRNLGATDAWLATLLTAQRLTSVVSYIVLGRLLTHKAFRKKLWISCLGMMFFPLTTALATTPEMLLIPALIGAIFSPGMNVFMTNTLFHVSPEDERASFIAANSFLGSVVAFIAPLVGTLLIGMIGIRLAIVSGAVLRFLGGLLFWYLGVGPVPGADGPEKEPLT